MGAIKLPHASGNSVSIASPQSNPAADRTLYLPSNADGTILTTTTPGAILQVKQNSDTTTTGTLSMATADQFYDVPNLNIAITPASSSNKILISYQSFGEGDATDANYRFRVKRAISGGATTYIQGVAATGRTQVMANLPASEAGGDVDSTPIQVAVSNYLDSPSTTSETTYTVQIGCNAASKEWNYNRSNTDSASSEYERGMSWITVMEVVA